MLLTMRGQKFMSGPLHFVKNVGGVDRLTSQFTSFRKTQYGRSESCEEKLMEKMFQQACQTNPGKQSPARRYIQNPRQFGRCPTSPVYIVWSCFGCSTATAKPNPWPPADCLARQSDRRPGLLAGRCVRLDVPAAATRQPARRPAVAAATHVAGTTLSASSPRISRRHRPRQSTSPPASPPPRTQPAQR